MEVFLLPILSGITVCLIILALFGKEPAKKRVRDRITGLMSDNGIDVIHDVVMKEKRRKTKSQQSSRLVSKKFEDELTASGIKLKAREYLIAWIGLTMLPVLILSSLGKSVMTILGAGLIGFIIPPLLVRRSKAKRQLLFNRQLSEVLIVMGNCIKSGYSFQQAMENVSKDMPAPISTEFSYVIREMRYGVNLDDALNHMVERTQNPDLALLVSAVITSSQVGANLTDILDSISATIKDRIKIRDEVRVLTAQGRMSGLIIGLLPIVIALALMLMNPDYIMTFFNSGLGRIMVAAGVLLEAIGFFAVKKVVDIKY